MGILPSISTKYLTSNDVVRILPNLTSGLYTSRDGGLDDRIQDNRRFSCKFTSVSKNEYQLRVPPA